MGKGSQQQIETEREKKKTISQARRCFALHDYETERPR